MMTVSSPGDGVETHCRGACLPPASQCGRPGGRTRGPVERPGPGLPNNHGLLALLVFCWRRGAERRCPAVQARAYVDDLTAHVTASPAEAVATANYLERHVRAFGESLEIVIIEAKSVRFAFTAEARRANAETARVAPAAKMRTVTRATDSRRSIAPAVEARRLGATISVGLRRARRRAGKPLAA